MAQRTREQISSAALNYVLGAGLHHRESGGHIDFCWPEDDARRNDPPCRLYIGTAIIVDAKRGTQMSVKDIADRDGKSFVEFVDHYARQPNTLPKQAAQAQKPQVDRTPVFEPAWAALTTAPDESTEREWVAALDKTTRAWVTKTRNLFPPTHLCAHCVVIDNVTAGPLLAACAGDNERSFLQSALPVVVMPIRNARTGLVSGLAWRSVAKRDADGRIVRKVLTGSKGTAPDGTPLVYGLRADLALYAHTVFLGEGLADSIAIEGLLPQPGPYTSQGFTPACPPIAVIGARDAGHMARVVGPFLAQRRHGRVLVVQHNDSNGVGQAAATTAHNSIGAKYSTLLRWGAFTARLRSCGVKKNVVLKDIADAVAAANLAGISSHNVWKSLVDSF